MKIYVIDNETKVVHQVGTDSHDSLYIDTNGGLQYYNLQCGCGTNTFGRYNPTYSFCNSKGEIPEVDEFTGTPEYEIKTDTEDYVSLIIQTIRMLKRWDLLLGHDGSNTKAMVRNDIQYLLKELEAIYKYFPKYWEQLHLMQQQTHLQYYKRYSLEQLEYKFNNVEKQTEQQTIFDYLKEVNQDEQS